MATEVVKIVDTGGGGDYSSLAAWEADFGSCTQANYPSMSGDGDLVGADLIAVADCRCSTGEADTDAVTVDGWTSTGAGNYIKIWTDPDQGYRHNGRWDDTKYRLDVTLGSLDYGLTIREDNIRILGIQLSVSRNNYQAFGISIPNVLGTTVDVRIASCIIKANFTGAEKTNIYSGIYSGDTDASGIKIWNNIIYDWNIGGTFPGRGIDVRYGSNIYLYNNTVYNCYEGIRGSGSPTHAINNLVQNCYNNCFVDTFSSDSDYNCDDDSTAPGTNSVTGTVTFIDAANDDFHLDSTDTVARDAGIDLSSDPNLAFTDDIDGETRSAPWDIGADEYVSGGGGETITLTAMSLQYAGKSLLTNETFNLDPFSLSFTGKTLFTSEAFNLVRKSLFFSGKNLFLNESMSLDRGVLSFSGKTLFFNEALRLARQALTWTGKELEAIQGYVVTLAAGVLSWAGRTLHLNETYSLAKGVLAFTGKNLAAFTGETVSMAKGMLTWAGNAISTNEVITLTKGTLKFIGKSLRGLGRTVRSELSTWLKIK